MISGLTLLVLGSLVGAAPCEHVVTGRVVDSVNGKPLSRTRIQAGASASPVRTDRAGRFKLEGLCQGALKLRAVRRGYGLRVMKISVPRGGEVHIKLVPIKVREGVEVRVQAPRLKASDTRSVVSLEGDALLRTRGENLADALANLPGVTVLRNGTTAKPVVRGQYGARVLKLFDGVRHEGQDWALDHGPEIDPFAAGAMRAVKGAAGVRYGPDAMAGVLLIEPQKLLKEPGLLLHTQAVGALNGKRGTFAARLDGNHEELPGLSWRVDGNYSRGSGLMTPNYPLDNTGVEEWNAGAVFEYQGDCWSAKVSYRRNSKRNGVCLCVRNETNADFDAQVLRDTPKNSEFYKADYPIERPLQQVTHDIALARARVDLEGVGVLEATYAYQLNDRQEFDIVRVETERAQYNFELHSHTLDVTLKHKPATLGGMGRLEGLMGLSGMFQDNVYRGWQLLSDYRALSGGIFALERLVLGNVELEAGARYDHGSRQAYIPENTYKSLVREDRMPEGDCILGETNARCASSFNAGTLSLGGLVRLSKEMSAKVDLSTATRMPTIDEQYISGTAPSFPIMARGRGDLGPETSWSLSGTFEANLKWLSAELSLYGSYIDDYIYLAPELREDGTIRTDVLINGRFPRFAYEAIDALYVGVDLNAKFRLGRFDVGLQGSLVRASDVDSGEFLLFIPSDRLRTELTYRLPETEDVVGSFVSLNATMVAPQYSVNPDLDFAPVPDGYVLFGASAGTSFKAGEQRYTLSAEVQNMLNTRYRDYTSMLRYYADEPGLQFFVRLGTELNL